MKTRATARRAWNRGSGPGALSGLLLVVLLASAPALRAQNVYVVAGDGSGDFVQLQQAVDAAAQGDVILVRAHGARYAATVIQDKALTIVGDGAVRPGVEDVVVRNLAGNRDVTLRFLDIAGRVEILGGVITIQEPGLELISNAGCVWLEDLVICGADGIPKWGGSEQGLPALVVNGSACVVAVDSATEGGSGGGSVGGSTYPGGHGGVVTSSQLALHGCSLVGGEGSYESLFPAEQGGIGLECNSATVFTSGSSLIGGDTGNVGGLTPDPTAAGLAVRDGSDVATLATSITSGGGDAPPGPPIEETGSPSSVEDLADDHRAFKLPPVLRELEPVRLQYRGQPGDLVLVQTSLRPSWMLVPALKGVQHLGVLIGGQLLGIVPPNGQLGPLVQVPALPPGTLAATGFAQPLALELDGSLRVSAPTSIVVVDATIPAP